MAERAEGAAQSTAALLYLGMTCGVVLLVAQFVAVPEWMYFLALVGFAGATLDVAVAIWRSARASQARWFVALRRSVGQAARFVFYFLP